MVAKHVALHGYQRLTDAQLKRSIQAVGAHVDRTLLQDRPFIAFPPSLCMGTYVPTTLKRKFFNGIEPTKRACIRLAEQAADAEVLCE